MRNRHEWKAERREGRHARREARAMTLARPLLPHIGRPGRYFLGLGLLFFCLWLPAFASLFRP